MPNTFLSQATQDTKYTKKLTRDFLIETTEFLKANDLTDKDVRWVGDAKGEICMTWAEFSRLAEGFIYMPRGRCAFMVRDDEKTVSYYDDEEGIMNRIPPDLTVVGDGWFFRRNIHMRMTPDELPRKQGALYGESAEFWEFITVPKRNSTLLIDNRNDVRLFATDNIKMARNLLTLNKEQAKGDVAFARFDDFERNKLKLSRRTGGTRRNVGATI